MKKDREKGTVFYLSIFIVVAVVVWGFLFPDHLADAAQEAYAYVTSTFGWFYLTATFLFLLFAIFLIFSPASRIKLGRDHDEPRYPFFTWLAMLFSAGMGIGLVFYGVAEPIYHYIDPPEGLTGETPAAARAALRYSFFHWGLQPWAIYTVIALAIAYTQFRKGGTGLISATFRPLLGHRVDGLLGKGIDTLAAVATAFGVATSLGLGTLQINGGLDYVFGIPNTTTVNLIIIVIVTALFLLSAISGLDRGIRYLSNLNLSIAGLLALFVLITGPTLFIMDALTTTVGSYLNNLVTMSFLMTPFSQGTFVGDWTIFYWAWWIAWAPFVGSFIARVSKGRTIREFVVGVLLVPTVLSMFWFSVFGGTALHMEIFEGLPIAEAVSSDMTSALFVTLEQLPWGMIISIVAILLITMFFVTSADSATFVLGMLTSQGTENPRTGIKIIWGILMSGIAGALLFTETGLGGLQTASLVIALPFTIILLLMMYSLYKALKREVHDARRRERKRLQKLERLLEREED
ncbi:hypothetical protein PA598K_05251 [Paenibacillus sp. 598K]|uniref:glycine betaine uptake BCCT transporter n=1 Tax=Paenibacillus sp. 598K TaxID=1117987 RepID=UPI000FF9229F|nr:BCCT family transporter [Paenibacillus sp. 598K]GBF76764.1 hypothetical protein PA598K_05251 [Paenibacillus sp. 598K]